MNGFSAADMTDARAKGYQDRVEHENEVAAQEAVAIEVPAGAIYNGFAYADRIETYGFECQAGPIANCNEWVEFRRCFEHLANWASELPALYAAPVAAAPVDPSKLGAAMRAFDDAGGHAISYAPAWMRKALEAASTPAAPGIDLASLLDIVSDLSQSAKVDDYEPQQIAFIESIRNRLLALIDASPKGGSDAVATKKNCPPPSWMFPEDEDPVPAANVTDWRAKAAAWLEEQAAEQENTNKAYPAHVAAYPSWTDRVHWLRTLASKVSESQATSAEVGA